MGDLWVLCYIGKDLSTPFLPCHQYLFLPGRMLVGEMVNQNLYVHPLFQYVYHHVRIFWAKFLSGSSPAFVSVKVDRSPNRLPASNRVHLDSKFGESQKRLQGYLFLYLIWNSLGVSAGFLASFRLSQLSWFPLFEVHRIVLLSESL